MRHAACMVINTVMVDKSASIFNCSTGVWSQPDWRLRQYVSGYCHLVVLQYNLNGSNTDGSFTVDDSNCFISPYKILPIAQEKIYLMIFFFLFNHGIVCCVYSLESRDSNEYTQYNHCVENRKYFPKLSLFASWTGAMITLSGSNYPCLEQISMVPKMFEPLRFNCILLGLQMAFEPSTLIHCSYAIVCVTLRQRTLRGQNT